MTPQRRWPENAENVRIDSLTRIRRIRETILNAQRLSREIEVIKLLLPALETTFAIERDLCSVGPLAEREGRSIIL